MELHNLSNHQQQQNGFRASNLFLFNNGISINTINSNNNNIKRESMTSVQYEHGNTSEYKNSKSVCYNLLSFIETPIDHESDSNMTVGNLALCQLFCKISLKIMIGIILGSIVCLSWLIMNAFLHATQIELSSNITVNSFVLSYQNKNSNTHICICYLLVWLSSICMIFVYPIYFLVKLCFFNKDKNTKKETAAQIFKSSFEVFDDKTSNSLKANKKDYHKSLIKNFLFTTMLWLLTGYSYVKTLDLMKYSESIYLFSISTSFTYIISWIVLKKQFVSIKLFGFLFSLCGVIFVVFHNGFYFSMKFLGCFLGGLAAVGTALLRLLMDYIIFKKERRHLMMIISIIGLFSLLFFWPIILLFYLTEFERVNFILDKEFLSTLNIRVGLIFGAYLLMIIYALIKRYGNQITYEICIKLGTLATLPLAMGKFIYHYFLF